MNLINYDVKVILEVIQITKGVPTENPTNGVVPCIILNFDPQWFIIILNLGWDIRPMNVSKIILYVEANTSSLV